MKKQIEEILSKYEKTDDNGFSFISTELDQDNLVNDLNTLFSIHDVVVPKGTLCDCKYPLVRTGSDNIEYCGFCQKDI